VTTPRLTEVFILEASMRAYQMIGWSRPEAKAWFEKTYGSVALEAAIITMALIKDQDDDYGADEVAEDPVVQRWFKSLKVSSKFRDAIKKHSAELISLKKQEIEGEGRAYTAISKIAQQYMLEPEGYEGETALEVEDGWKWVHLTDDECRDFEGAAMQHCGQASGLMFSLRDPQNKPHVTMDVSPSGGVDDGPLNIPANDVIQIRGKQNSIPDMKYWPKIKELVKQVGAKALWDSYPVSGEEEDGRGLVRSRKFADFLELKWAHDPDSNPDVHAALGDDEEPMFDEPTPLDQYEF
jgi:hypothetical protein